MAESATHEARPQVRGGVAAIVAIACIVAAGSLPGCVSHSCEAVAYVCQQTQITLQAPNNAWAAGMYTLGLTLDGALAQCTISVPASPSSSGVSALCPLGGPYLLELEPVESCPPVVCNDSACEGMSCTPIADQFQMTVTIPGLPTQVGLLLSRDGNALMNETVRPVSMTGEPNGKGCGTCTNAVATASIAE